MFDLWGRSVDVPLPGLELPAAEVPASQRLIWEKELLGVYLTDQPFAHISASEVDVLCGQITDEMAGQTVITAGTVTSVRHAFTRDRRPFLSATLEDFGGSVEVTAWADVYEHTKDLWVEGNTLVVTARVRTRNDNVQLTCLRASVYQPGKVEGSPESREPDSESNHRLIINFTASDDSETDIARLRRIFDALRQYPGDYRIRLTIQSGEEVTNMEVPDLAADYCPELRTHLASLLGEEALLAD